MKRSWQSLAGAARKVAPILALIGCYPTTTRPAFLPKPTAPMTEIELGIPEATRAVAAALDADSIPVRRTEAKDGWLESDWFDAATFKPTSRRHLGSGVVKVRVWVDPSRPNYSTITAETVYRPFADPSRPDRELEQQVPPNHPVNGRVLVALGKLSRQFGGVIVDTAVKADSGKVTKGDSGKTARPDIKRKPPIKPPQTP